MFIVYTWLCMYTHTHTHTVTGKWIIFEKGLKFIEKFSRDSGTGK